MSGRIHREYIVEWMVSFLPRDVQSSENVASPPVAREKRRERRRMTSLIKWFRRNHFAVIVLFLLLEFYSVPYQQLGFFCNDPKISFKFRGDTVSMSLLIGTSLVLPLIVMWITEHICYSADSYESASYFGTRGRQIWRWYGHYFAGSITLSLFCSVTKLLIGEPRPHFLDTCKPREAVNCTDEYIFSYTCTNTELSRWLINDSSKSFPSGHAALSIYMSIFLVWYLQNRLLNWTLFLKPSLQCLMAMWTIACSMTRMSDNRHHWWDILAGNVLGLLSGVFVVVVSCRHFCLEYTATATATYALNEPLENGQIGGYDVQRKQNAKKLNPAVVDVSESRELKDAATWRK